MTGSATADQPPADTERQARWNNLAGAAVVAAGTGMVTLVCFGLGGVLSLAGAILGHWARAQIRKSAERGAGLALAGIIMGWTGFALGVVVIVAVVRRASHLTACNFLPCDPAR